MRIAIDRSKCQAYGNCADEAPNLFTLDDEGYAVLSGGEQVPSGEEPVARAAARSCPAQAIKTAE